MNVLIDTNILTRLAQPGRASHSSALAALDTLRASGDRICVVPQNLYDFGLYARVQRQKTGWE